MRLILPRRFYFWRHAVLFLSVAVLVLAGVPAAAVDMPTVGIARYLAIPPRIFALGDTVIRDRASGVNSAMQRWVKFIGSNGIFRHCYRTRLVLCTACAIVGAVAWTSPAWAEGSVSFAATILPLIKARPTFEKFVTDTFEITDTGWGIRIGNEAMPHLGGARVGPYRFQAVSHGCNGGIPVTLVVDTDIRFFDRKGREITNGPLRNAVSFKETFSSIEIEPPRN